MQGLLYLRFFILILISFWFLYCVMCDTTYIFRRVRKIAKCDY